MSDPQTPDEFVEVLVGGYPLSGANPLPIDDAARGLPLALTGATAATRYVGGTATGSPTTGTFAKGDYVVAEDGQLWVCTSAGTPGTWVAVGSGRAIGGPTVLGTDFTMTTAATEEDVPGFNVSFTYDGRPVRLYCFCPYVAQDQAALKIITLKMVRTSDSAVQAQTGLVNPATAFLANSMTVDTGPITAWPSDGAALVLGTSYTVKMRITSQAASKASIFGSAGSKAHLVAYSC